MYKGVQLRLGLGQFGGHFVDNRFAEEFGVMLGLLDVGVSECTGNAFYGDIFVEQISGEGVARCVAGEGFGELGSFGYFFQVLVVFLVRYFGEIIVVFFCDRFCLREEVADESFIRFVPVTPECFVSFFC